MKNCPTMPDLDRQDYVILNSTVNVPKAIDVLSPYERIHCMLDNDKAGYEATRAIELEYSYRVRDFSHNYRGYSDLNDYLCGRKQEHGSHIPFLLNGTGPFPWPLQSIHKPLDLHMLQFLRG